MINNQSISITRPDSKSYYKLPAATPHGNFASMPICPPTKINTTECTISPTNTSDPIYPIIPQTNLSQINYCDKLPETTSLMIMPPPYENLCTIYVSNQYFDGSSISSIVTTPSPELTPPGPWSPFLSNQQTFEPRYINVCHPYMCFGDFVPNPRGSKRSMSAMPHLQERRVDRRLSLDHAASATPTKIINQELSNFQPTKPKPPTKKRPNPSTINRSNFPYLCNFPGCDFRCKRKDNLNSHMRTHEPKRYFCKFDFCYRKERGFTRRNELKRHYWSHVRKFERQLHKKGSKIPSSGTFRYYQGVINSLKYEIRMLEDNNSLIPFDTSPNDRVIEYEVVEEESLVPGKRRRLKD